MLAGIVGAVILVDLAVDSGVAAGTDALVGAPAVVAGSPVLTRVGVTLIKLEVASCASPACRTVADEPGDVILAGAAVAGIVPALVNVRLTSLPVPSGPAPT